MKIILFLLFALALNFLLYLTPGLLLFYCWKKWKRQTLFTVDLANFYDRMLTFSPFVIWSLLYVFDPEQKTVQQIIFPDPLVIGLFSVIFLIINHHYPQNRYSASFQWSFIAITNAVAVACWFWISPLA